MGKDYEGYLKKRMRNSYVVSWAEAELLAIADHNPDAPDNFYMVHTSIAYYTVYHCYIERINSTKPKIRIKSIGQDYSINLPSPDTSSCNKEIIHTTFKSLYALSPMAPIAITGKYSQCHWLLEVLSFYFKTIIKVTENVNYSPDLKNRISIDPQLKKAIVNVNRPNASLYTLLNNSQPIYIPVCEPTLSGLFYSNITWRDLIGEERDTVLIENIPCIPAYINTEIDAYNNVFVCLTYILNPNAKRRILIESNGKHLLKDSIILKSTYPDRYSEKDKSIEKDNIIACHPKSKNYPCFIFNGVSYDMSQLSRDVPNMDKTKLSKLKSDVQRALQDIIRVDYIVTDTNNWCTYDNVHAVLTYEDILERFAKIIERNSMHTKFYVINEILTELKRLTKKKIGARLAQNLLSHNFMQRGLIEIPNADEEIDPTIVADGCIKNHIKSLYLSGKKISVISLDRQAMMIWQATINNISMDMKDKKQNLTYPKFLGLDNVKHLFTLWNMIYKREKLINN